MKSVRLICVCVVLFGIFVLAANVVAIEIDYRHEESGIFIECEELEVKLTLTKEDGFLIFRLKSDGETLTVARSFGDGENQILMRCVEDSTGNIMLLSEKKSRILSTLWSKIDFKPFDEDYKDFAWRVFNLLESWPSNMPVYIESSVEKTIYLNSDNELSEVYTVDPSFQTNSNLSPLPPFQINYYVPEGESLTPLPDAGESLCDCQGEYADGHVLRYGDTAWNIYEGYTQARWTEDFNARVGYQKVFDNHTEGIPDCRGRCGIGCSGWEYDVDKEIYTQRCFNHDHCVEMYGYVARNCNAMLGACIRDYFLGKDCGCQHL